MNIVHVYYYNAEINRTQISTTLISNEFSRCNYNIKRETNISTYLRYTVYLYTVKTLYNEFEGTM